MGSTAKIIDFAAYRQRRIQSETPVRLPMVVLVAVWTYVPVFVVPGYF